MRLYMGTLASETLDQILDTMETDVGTIDATVLKVMGQEHMSICFSGTPLLGGNSLGVQFTDGTTLSENIIQDSIESLS